MGKTKKGVQPFQVKRGSLAARAARDPALRQRIKQGRRRSASDEAAMKRWAQAGFSSPPEEA